MYSMDAHMTLPYMLNTLFISTISAGSMWLPRFLRGLENSVLLNSKQASVFWLHFSLLVCLILAEYNITETHVAAVCVKVLRSSVTQAGAHFLTPFSISRWTP